MKSNRLLVMSMVVLLSLFFSTLSQAQPDKIIIPAGTPEDQALQAIYNEPDAQKKLPMYEDFLQKFSSNPAAVAYADWQISQYYETSGDFQKALDYGDKALASSPHNLDILVSQASIAQQMKDSAKTFGYSIRGGEAYNSIAKQPKPADMSDADFAIRIQDEKNSAKSGYEFVEASAFNAIAAEKDAKTRMQYIDRFSVAFPNSRFSQEVGSYAMLALSELKDPARAAAYGEKTLQTNPDSLPILIQLAGIYVEDPKPGSLTKAITYSQKAIEVAKANAPDADRGRKVSAGVAHYTLGYAYLKQDKAVAAIPELKAAAALLKGEDDQEYALTLFRLGFAYGKLSKVTEARDVLTEAVKIPGPVQQPAQDLLAKVNAARAKGK
jgi:tetratricopeptide (TPR) repeat protein